MNGNKMFACVFRVMLRTPVKHWIWIKRGLKQEKPSGKQRTTLNLKKSTYLAMKLRLNIERFTLCKLRPMRVIKSRLLPCLQTLVEESTQDKIVLAQRVHVTRNSLYCKFKILYLEVSSLVDQGIVYCKT